MSINNGGGGVISCFLILCLYNVNSYNMLNSFFAYVMVKKHLNIITNTLSPTKTYFVFLIVIL